MQWKGVIFRMHGENFSNAKVFWGKNVWIVKFMGHNDKLSPFQFTIDRHTLLLRCCIIIIYLLFHVFICKNQQSVFTATDQIDLRKYKGIPQTCIYRRCQID